MIRLCACALTILVLFGAETNAQEPSPPNVGPRAAIADFFNAWNTASNDALREEIHVPMLSLFGDRLMTANEAEEFIVDFEGMRTNEGWARSTLDKMEPIVDTPDQSHFIVDYSRRNSDRQAYRSGRVFYAVTKKDDDWRIQLRAPMGDATDKAEALEIAKGVIALFFAGWNGEDNPAIHKTLNFPHAFLIRDGRASVAEGPENLNTNFAAMRDREGWDKSEYDSLRIAHADENLILAYLTFTRHHEDGEVYRTVPVLWMLTRGEDDEWGIQIRIILGNL